MALLKPVCTQQVGTLKANIVFLVTGRKIFITRVRGWRDALCKAPSQPRTNTVYDTLWDRGSETKVQVFVCYRPPKHYLDDNLSLYESLSGLVWKKTSVLAGDCPGVDWKTDIAVRKGLSLLDFKQDNFLSQKVWEPTRGTHFLLRG